MDDRRYRQRDYKPDPGAAQAKRDLPRPPSQSPVLKNRPVSRCAECGAVLPITADSLEQCPNCRVELHSCRQCMHFDTARRFECAQPIPAHIADKRGKNDCAFFSLSVRVERETGSAPIRPDDARRGFGNLFKK